MDRTAARRTPPHAHHDALAAYDSIALVLQGGGALGAYQGGVVEGLAEAGIVPNRVSGISIGAINAAILAGNPPERWVERLGDFWETICRHPLFADVPSGVHGWLPGWLDPRAWHGIGADLRSDRGEGGLGALPAEARKWLGMWEAWRAVLEGQNGFFLPRGAELSAALAGNPGSASFYDTRPLKGTLERFVDFDRINARTMRVSVGAVNVATGNFVYFDNWNHKLRPEHFMASGALPPGFPAVEIDGEFYWDGGLVSNTPLAEVAGDAESRRTLVFQVDLWSAAGRLPRDLSEVALRQKDIQFSSRTRMVTALVAKDNERNALLRELLELIPEERRATSPACRKAAEVAADRRLNVVHLIYREKPTEGHYKDYQFDLATMREHWRAGLSDIRGTLEHPDWLQMPPADEPSVTHDVHRGSGSR